MPSTTPELTARAEAVWAVYGSSGGVPAYESWARLAALHPDQPVTLINFFRMRAQAAYPAGHKAAGEPVSGQAAFDRYAAVSGPCLSEAGGRFLLVAPSGGAFIGDPEEWDLVAIGTYPGPGAVLSLFEQPAYRAAYVHRTAACADQRVTLCLGGPLG